MTFAEVRALMLADSKRSGLGEKEVKTLGFRPLTREQLQREFPNLTTHPLAGYVIPYFDIHGKRIRDFFRFRYLEEITGFAALAQRKPLRYVQPQGTPPRLYVPRNFAGWGRWLESSERQLILTEGEKKAAAGCKYGFATMALGGVWNFRSKAQRWSLLPDLEALPLEGTRIYIAYDSDAASNRDIIQAQNALAKELIDRKAFVFIVSLPALELGQKTGLDDYLKDEGREAFARLLDETEEWEASRALHEMNEEAVFIRKSAEVLIYKEGDLYSPRKFLDVMANRTYQDVEITTTAKGKQIEKAVTRYTAKEWFRSGIRNDVLQLVYEPGKPETIHPAGARWPDYNSWPGWGTEPVEGDPSLFRELIDHLTHECSDAERLWFWQWLAYPIQYPGAKLFSSVLFHGGQGTGKTFVGEIMERIYGENYKLVDDAQLLGVFNTWAKNRQFVLGDEIGTQYRKAADIMKGIISRNMISVNTKFVAEYEIRDCINYLFTSNSPNAAYLEEDDRRHFVVNVQQKPLPDSFYSRLKQWKDSGEGPSHLMHHLLYRVNTKGFNPSARPPLTAAKERMIDTSRSAAAQWAVDLRSNGHGMLKRLATPSQLTPLFVNARHDSLGDSKLMKIVLHSAGFRQALGGKQIKVNKSWGMQRFWIIDQKLNDLLSPSNAVVDEIRQMFLNDYGKGKTS